MRNGLAHYVGCGPAEFLLNSLGANTVDLTVTSPPYDNVRGYNGFSFDPVSIIDGIYRVTKWGGVVVWVVGDQTVNGSETGTSFKHALAFMERGFKLHDTMIYERSNPPLTHRRYEQSFEYMFVFVKGAAGPKTFNGIRVPRKYPEKKPRVKAWHRWNDGSFKIAEWVDARTDTVLRNNVWRAEGRPVCEERIAHKHPAIFPEWLAHDHIVSWSKPGDVVLDPFMGSGTTLKMAHVLGRNYVGIDLSEDYIQLAKDRLAIYKATQRSKNEQAS